MDDIVDVDSCHSSLNVVLAVAVADDDYVLAEEIVPMSTVSTVETCESKMILGWHGGRNEVGWLWPHTLNDDQYYVR